MVLKYTSIVILVLAKLFTVGDSITQLFNPLMPNDLQRRHAVNPLKIKIPSKNV
jgi:hypothetical protein